MILVKPSCDPDFAYQQQHSLLNISENSRATQQQYITRATQFYGNSLKKNKYRNICINGIDLTLGDNAWTSASIKQIVTHILKRQTRIFVFSFTRIVFTQTPCMLDRQKHIHTQTFEASNICLGIWKLVWIITISVFIVSHV